MSTLVPTDEFLRIRPAGVEYAYDEVFDTSGTARTAWQPFLAAAQRVTIEELARRTAQAEQQLCENGVTYNVFHDGQSLQRPWRLDLLPMIFAAQEWRSLELGLAQRARLLQAIARDCYGPRSLLADGVLPPEVLLANPGFVRTFSQLDRGDAPFFSTYAAELARRSDGTWCVMADRAESPAGAAFALENRVVSSRTIPAALHLPQIRRIAPFFVQYQETLRTLGRRHAENPRIVLLSPGARYPYYFEDVYLARYLGYSLVEGADLAVRDDRVYLKTLAGLIPVDVIVSRGTERGLDPLELGGGATHGVPGLLHAMRRGRVTIVNTPGSGLVESPVFMAFLPDLCRRLLGEELMLPSIATWWCGNPRQRQYVREHLEELVIKPAFQASGGEEIVVSRLSATERQELLEQLDERPRQFIAQDLIARSAVPMFLDGQLKTGHAALRTFLVAAGEDFVLMPGALVRLAASTDPMELSISAGVSSKDLWVLADEPEPPVTLLQHEHQPVPLRRTSALFPSRVADDLYWLGHALDRADFLSRLLRAVIERLTAEAPADVPEMPALLRVLAYQGQIEPGFAIGSLSAGLPDLGEHLPRCVSDTTEVRGLAAALTEMERLASLERLWISPDTWRTIRDAAADFREAAAANFTGLVDVLNAVNEVIVDIAAVSGLIQDGMVRSPAWRLLDMGRRVERAANIANMLSAVLDRPLAATDNLADRLDPPALERPLLKALLEIIDCRMTYRSRYLDTLQSHAVLDLCLTDETCPRSIAAQLVALTDHVETLPHDLHDPLRTDEKRVVSSALHSVRMLSDSELRHAPPREVQATITLVEDQMRQLSQLLTRKYLLHSGEPRQITADVELPG